MTQYIDKGSLVAEIKRLKNIYNDDENIHHVAKYNILVDILSFINTLEVKEVDLEKALDDYVYQEGLVNCYEITPFAKHFFELGMAVRNKAQKGE